MLDPLEQSYRRLYITWCVVPAFQSACSSPGDSEQGLGRMPDVRVCSKTSGKLEAGLCERETYGGGALGKTVRNDQGLSAWGCWCVGEVEVFRKGWKRCARFKVLR